MMTCGQTQSVRVADTRYRFVSMPLHTLKHQRVQDHPIEEGSAGTAGLPASAPSAARGVRRAGHRYQHRQDRTRQRLGRAVPAQRVPADRARIRPHPVHGVPRGAGFGATVKSACVGCPFHGNTGWRWIRDHDPEGWAEAVEFDRLHPPRLTPTPARRARSCAASASCTGPAPRSTASTWTHLHGHAVTCDWSQPSLYRRRMLTRTATRTAARRGRAAPASRSRARRPGSGQRDHHDESRGSRCGRCSTRLGCSSDHAVPARVDTGMPTTTPRRRCRCRRAA